MMGVYDYHKAVMDAVKDKLVPNWEEHVWAYQHYPKSFQYTLYDWLIDEDSVTGNSSGSFTFSEKKATENLYGNMGLLAEALESFGENVSFLERGAEACDVLIRCYVLDGVLGEIVERIEREIEAEARWERERREMAMV